MTRVEHLSEMIFSSDTGLLEITKNSQFTPITLKDFLALDLPPRQLLLSPWLPEKGIAMLYAYRGIGKTWFALNVAYACATGSQFLGWESSGPVNVLYIDGEMPARALQDRLKSIVRILSVKDCPENFKIITPDLTPDGAMPDLSTSYGQQSLNEATDWAQFIIVDNLSTLCRSGRENEGESWLSVQAWALRMRARGKTILFIHHAGKGGQQRGTSRREDVLDTVIALRSSTDDQEMPSTKFELHFEKTRDFQGIDAESREVEMITMPDDSIEWRYQPLREGIFSRVVSLLNDGLSQADIARELECNKSTVSRYAKRAKEEGLLSGPPSPSSDVG